METQEKMDIVTYFPSLWQAVVFRNYGLVAHARLAKVLGCSLTQLKEAAKNLGIDKIRLNRAFLKYSFLTIVRQNWQLLNMTQICELIGWEQDKLALYLSETNELSKLGTKIQGKDVCYGALSEEQQHETLKIKTLVLSNVKSFKTNYFSFLKTLGARHYQNLAEEGIKAVQFFFEGLTESDDFYRYYHTFCTRYDLKPLTGKKVYVKKEYDGAFLGEQFNVEFDFNRIYITAATDEGLFCALKFIAEVGSGGIMKETFNHVPHLSERIGGSYVLGSDEILPTDKALTDNILCELCLHDFNGIQIAMPLYKLCNFRFNTSLSQGHAKRLMQLNDSIINAKNYAMKVYIHLIEPSQLPISAHSELLKAEVLGDKCKLNFEDVTSKNYLYNAIKKILKTCPSLGGFIVSEKEESGAFDIILKAVKASGHNAKVMRQECKEYVAQSLPFYPLFMRTQQDVKSAAAKGYFIAENVAPGMHMRLLKDLFADTDVNLSYWIMDGTCGDGEKVLKALNRLKTALDGGAFYKTVNLSRLDFVASSPVFKGSVGVSDYFPMGDASKWFAETNYLPRLKKMTEKVGKALKILHKTSLGGEHLLYLTAESIYLHLLSAQNYFTLFSGISSAQEKGELLESERANLKKMINLMGKNGAIGYDANLKYMDTFNSLLERLIVSYYI